MSDDRDDEAPAGRTQDITPEDGQALVDAHHGDETAAEAAERADPRVTPAHPGA